MRHSLLKSVLIIFLIFSLVQAPAAAGSGEEAEVTVYFPNWNIYSDSKARVGNLPWERLDCVNHAFWKVAPEGKGFAVVSTDPWADTDPGNPNAHFPRYAECAEKHPDTKILLSIGGWTACGFFSEMALTAESRASFIRSCLDTLEAWPFLSGLDIDWEYPGAAREPEDESDEGCPVLGDDRTNYTLLLREMREALDAHFGAGKKTLTVCACASLGILALQDYAALFPYVDRINLMTYDLAGSWDDVTGHQTALWGSNSADAAVKYLLSLGVPAEKIAIGSPLYSREWKLLREGGKPVGAAGKGTGGEGRTWRELVLPEKTAVPEGTPGWHAGYDEQAEAAWLWNDDPASADYLTFCSYENTRSLDAKLDYIKAQRLGGLIVWQVHGDDAAADWPMITRMHDALHM